MSDDPEFSVGEVVYDDHYGVCRVKLILWGGALIVRILSSGRTLRQHGGHFKRADDAITALGWLGDLRSYKASQARSD